MQPDNIKMPENNPTAIPMSYLDQIAAPPPKRMNIFNNKIALLGAIAVGLIIIAIGVSLIPKPVDPVASLAARLNATKKVADDASSKLKNSQLRSINSNLKIYLTNTIRNITPFLTKQNISITKLDAKIVAAEATTEMEARLEDARLNATYDRTYAREMSYKLSTIISLFDESTKKAKTKDFITFLESSKAELSPTQEQFDDFNSTTNSY